MFEIVAIFIGLAALQALFAWCLVRWARNTKSAPENDNLSEQQIRQSLYNLHTVASTLAENVDEHQEHVGKLNEQLAQIGPGGDSPLAALALSFTSQIVQANRRLQRRLTRSERRLEEQSREIESHMVEARTDALTRLPNRRSFDEATDRLHAQWRRTGNGYALMLLDVDHFKRINDTHGHPAGDQVLADLARALRATTRDADMLCRYGGEEFAVLLPNTQAEGVLVACERFRKSIERRRHKAGEVELAITVSIGAAQSRTGEEPEALLQRADDALYAAKHAGRNCAFFHDGLDSRRVTPALPAPAAGGSPGGNGVSSEEAVAGEEESPRDAVRDLLCQEVHARLLAVTGARDEG